MIRIVELSTRITGISRRDGRSATAAAAYRACCAIHCEREGRLHDYTRKSGLEASRIVAPAGSPAWAADRSALWNAAELRERNGRRGPNARQFKADAKTAREFMFTFPAELSPDGRLAVAERIARHLADTHGIVADFSIHRPGKDGDERNVHCHMLTTTRRMTENGLGAKAREWDAFSSGAKLSKAFRAFVAAALNEALAAEGQAGVVHVEHLSFEARGGGRRAQRHLGPNKTNAIRRELREARRAWQSAHGNGLKERHVREREALVERQTLARAQKLRDLADREARALTDVRPDRSNESAPARPGVLQRLTRLFGHANGQDRSGTPERASPDRAADSRQAEIKAGIAAERDSYIAGQDQERRALAEQQAAATRQLDNATGHRVVQDRAVEQQHRRAPEPARDDRRHDIGRDQSRTR